MTEEEIEADKERRRKVQRAYDLRARVYTKPTVKFIMSSKDAEGEGEDA